MKLKFKRKCALKNIKSHKISSSYVKTFGKYLKISWGCPESG